MPSIDVTCVVFQISISQSNEEARENMYAIF